MEEIVKLAETVKEPVKYFLGHLLSMDEKPQVFTIEEVNKIIQETNYIIEENKYIVAEAVTEAVTKTVKVEYTKKIIICVLVLIILAIIGYFIYKHFFKEKKVIVVKDDDKEKSGQ